MLIGLGKMVKKVVSNLNLLASRIIGFTTIPSSGGSGYYTTTVGTNKDVMLMHSAWTGWVSYSYDDGLTWDLAFQLPNTNGGTPSIAVIGNTVVFRPNSYYTSEASVYVSKDGKTYETVIVGDQGTLENKIIVVGDYFVIHDGDYVTYWSKDGLVWDGGPGRSTDVYSYTNYNGQKYYWRSSTLQSRIFYTVDPSQPYGGWIAVGGYGPEGSLPNGMNPGNKTIYVQEGLYYTFDDETNTIMYNNMSGPTSPWNVISTFKEADNSTDASIVQATTDQNSAVRFTPLQIEGQTQSFGAVVAWLASRGENDTVIKFAYSTNIYNWIVSDKEIPTSISQFNVTAGDYGKFIISYAHNNTNKIASFGIFGNRGDATGSTMLITGFDEGVSDGEQPLGIMGNADGSYFPRVSWVNNEWVILAPYGRVWHASTPEGGQGWGGGGNIPMSNFSYTLDSNSYWQPVKYINGKYVTAYYGHYLFGHGALAFTSPAIESDSWSVFEFPLGNFTHGPMVQNINTLVEIQTSIGDQNNGTAEILAPVNVYTVPAGKITTLDQISLINETSSPLTYDLGILQPGKLLTEPNSIKWDEPLSGNATSNLTRSDVLIAGETITILPSTVDALTARVFGTEANSFMDINLAEYVGTTQEYNYGFVDFNLSLMSLDGIVYLRLSDLGQGFANLFPEEWGTQKNYNPQYPDNQGTDPTYLNKAVVLKGFDFLHPSLENAVGTLAGYSLSRELSQPQYNQANIWIELPFLNTLNLGAPGYTLTFNGMEQNYYKAFKNTINFPEWESPYTQIASGLISIAN